MGFSRTGMRLAHLARREAVLGVVGDKGTGRGRGSIKETFGFQEFGLFSRATGAPEGLCLGQGNAWRKTCFRRASLM